MSDLPVIGPVTHFWTMGSNLSSFAEFRELTGNPLAGALAIRAKQIGEPSPDGVTAEDYIRRVHQFDPADAITAAMVPHLERKVYGNTNELDMVPRVRCPIENCLIRGVQSKTWVQYG